MNKDHTTDGDDLAHPFTYVDRNREIIFRAQGLTKREYFAALVLQGITANPAYQGQKQKACEEAVLTADALIDQLNKETE